MKGGIGYHGPADRQNTEREIFEEKDSLVKERN